MRGRAKFGAVLGSGVVCAALVACGGSGGSGGTAEPDASAVDAAPVVGDAAVVDASLAETLAQYCRDVAAAKCGWAFKCASAADRSGVLSLPGGDEAACAEAAAAACIEDTASRAERGTVEWHAERADDCVTGAGNAPCQDTAASEWVSQWLDYLHQRCGSVLPGTVAKDGACERYTDCVDGGQLCLEGTCKDSSRHTLQQPCTATSHTADVFNTDDSCPGGICVQVGPNDQDLSGLCSIDCTEGTFRCPTGTACIQASIGGHPSYFCSVPCTRDSECEQGTVCAPVDKRQPLGSKHCWGRKG